MLFNLIALVMKYLKSLILVGAFLSPLSLILELSITETLLDSSNYGFTLLLLCIILNGIMYLIRCAVVRKTILFNSFISGGVRLAFYTIILMTAYNYELNMTQIYGTDIANQLFPVRVVRHILLNMMIIYELEMTNNSYKEAFKKNLPIIGMLVKVRNAIQGKIVNRFKVNDVCPNPEIENNEEPI